MLDVGARMNVSWVLSVGEESVAAGVRALERETVHREGIEMDMGVEEWWDWILKPHAIGRLEWISSECCTDLLPGVKSVRCISCYLGWKLLSSAKR